MKRIKTFSAITESASDSMIYTTKVSTYPNLYTGVTIDFYNEPDELYGVNVIDGTVNWTIEMNHNKRGIEFGEASIKSMELTLEMEDKISGEESTDTISLSESDFDSGAIRTELNGFPLYVSSIEIQMNGSSDPKMWKITLNIGND